MSPRYLFILQPLRINDTSTFFNSFFKGDRQTFFVIHGYLESGNKTWIKVRTKFNELKNYINLLMRF